MCKTIHQHQDASDTSSKRCQSQAQFQPYLLEKIATEVASEKRDDRCADVVHIYLLESIEQVGDKVRIVSRAQPDD